MSAACAELKNNLTRDIARIERAILCAKGNKHPAITNTVTHHPVNILVPQQEVSNLANHISIVDVPNIANQGV
jgi:hypothetical protein